MYRVEDWKGSTSVAIAALKVASIETKNEVDDQPCVSELRLLQWEKEGKVLYSVVLCQDNKCENEGTKSDTSSILLFESCNEDDSIQAFAKLKQFVSLLKFGRSTRYSVQHLSDLITQEGPISSNDRLIRQLVVLDIPEPLNHPDLQADVHVNDFHSHLLLLAAQHGSERAVQHLMSVDTNDTDSTDGPFHSKRCKHQDVTPPKNCKKGEDALLVAIRHGKFHCAVKLLLRDCSANSQMEGSGDTALHLAACTGHPLIVKALILFGADMSIKNNEGKTAIDACSSPSCSANVAECVRIMKEIQDLATHSKAKMQPSTPKSNVDPTSPRLLCLDGGGIRGLVEVIILTELDAVLRELDPTASHLVDYFDFVAGTSTGSFIAALLVYQQSHPASLKKTYFRFKDEVFSHGKPIRSSVSDRAAKQVFGDKHFLGDVEEPKVMITTTMPNTSPPLQHLMCNYGKARDGEKAPDERKVWEACRASSAAPTYFESFERKFVDGGVVANNPTLDAMTEVLKLQEDKKEPLNLGLVLSIGSGVCEAVPNFAHIPHLQLWNPANIVQVVNGAIGLLKLLIQEDTASNGPIVDRARMWCKSIGSTYYRISPEISPAVKLDDTNDNHLIQMMYQTLVYVRQNRDTLKEIAHILLLRKPRAHVQSQ